MGVLVQGHNALWITCPPGDGDGHILALTAAKSTREKPLFTVQLGVMSQPSPSLLLVSCCVAGQARCLWANNTCEPFCTHLIGQQALMKLWQPQVPPCCGSWNKSLLGMAQDLGAAPFLQQVCWKRSCLWVWFRALGEMEMVWFGALGEISVLL